MLLDVAADEGAAPAPSSAIRTVSGVFGRPPTALDRMSAGRISFSEQWSARWAICQHVNGGLTGPRFRRGSNSWRDNFAEAIMNPALALSPCPNCGASGDDLLPGPCAEFCPACKTVIPKGDYDWTSLSDCLRFQADRDAGLLETEEELFRCSKCRRPHSEAWPNWPAPNPALDCAVEGCPLYCSPAQQAELDARADAERERQLATLRARPRRVEPVQSELDAMLERLGQALDQAADRTGAGADEAPYDACRRNFDRETAAAAERDRARA